MMKNVKKLAIIILFILLLTNRNEAIKSCLLGVSIWLEQLLPSLFPFFIFSDLFVSSGIVNDLSNKFGSIFSSIFKVSKYSFFIFFISLFSGCPTNAKNINNMLENNYIDKLEAEKILCFTMFYNPFLIYSITSLYLTHNDSLKAIFIVYITNIIIGLIIRKKKCLINKLSLNNLKKIDLIDSIKNTIYSLINILGTIIFMMLLITLLKTHNIYFNNIINGLLEITSGIINLSALPLNYNLKFILTIVYLMFGGVSIHLQIKSILKDTISYKLFYKTRLMAVLIGLLLTIIT